ncbi:calpain-A-like [Ctenocephalides felis]|uniref:calpain-A-like n=1 Tax=Ctenocephalides felis TaxID=7515 RepID=UPI000E6E39B5|nr:calpain-A-like [Ctenocephalides felis]XP_026482301.1 calpain-A-like [Ctenocephalides felis]
MAGFGFDQNGGGAGNFEGLLRGAGQKLMGYAGDKLMGAAKDVVGGILNELFIKKEAQSGKRILPSIKNMKVVCGRIMNDSR